MIAKDTVCLWYDGTALDPAGLEIRFAQAIG